MVKRFLTTSGNIESIEMTSKKRAGSGNANDHAPSATVSSPLTNFSLQRRPAKLSDEVTLVLRREIERHRLPIGERLPSELELAKSFGVSRTVVREAIARLRADGLVVSRQGAGVFVSGDRSHRPFRILTNGEMADRSIIDVFELRIGVESEAAALAAERRTAQQLGEMEQNKNRIAELIKAGKVATADDVAFHLSISEATGNRQFENFIRFISNHLYDAVHLARTNSARFEGRPWLVQEEHEAVFGAIKDKDPKAAHTAMRDHLIRAKARLTVAEQPADDQPEGLHLPIG